MGPWTRIRTFGKNTQKSEKKKKTTHQYQLIDYNICTRLMADVNKKGNWVQSRWKLSVPFSQLFCEKWKWSRSVLTTLCDPMDCSPEKAMATHSSTLAWRIPWTEEPGGLQSMRSLRSRFEPLDFKTHWREVVAVFYQRQLIKYNLRFSVPVFWNKQKITIINFTGFQTYFWMNTHCRSKSSLESDWNHKVVKIQNCKEAKMHFMPTSWT